MFDVVHQASEFKPRSSLPQLSSFRDQALSEWRSNSFPDRKTEDWRYLNLRALATENYFSSALQRDVGRDAFQRIAAIPDLDGYSVVMVNGYFSESLSSLPDDSLGLQVKKFSEASHEELSEFLNSTFNQKAHIFSQLNACHFDDGIYIKVAKNAVLEKPLHLVNLFLPQEKKFSVSPRVLLVAEPGSQVSVIDHFVSDESVQNCFINGIAEYCVQENASVNLYQLNMLQEDALQMAGVHAKLQKNACFNGFYLSLGSKLQRSDITVTFNGQGGAANLQGVYLPRNNQQVDYHTSIEHAVPHCTSKESFRGIVSDTAKAVFNGRIHIHRDAQKTLAQLSNKNLLTSNKAEVDTKPELEIYADDVQCAHGATVAQLDLSALHYLTTRGVSVEEAKVMLSFGFINELIEKIQRREIADYLRPVLAKRFATNYELVRHLL